MADRVAPSPEDVERMIERLRAVSSPGVYERCPGGWRSTNALYRNPDGPAAADMLAALSAIGGGK